MADYFQNYIAPGAGLAATVFQHQQLRSEHESQACPVEPNWCPHVPAGSQERGGSVADPASARE
jgi:hypothetical protein